MKLIIAAVLAAVCAVVLVGCGMRQPAEEIAVEKEVLYAVNFPAVWTAVISIFAECNLPVSNMERDSGFVNCSAFGVEREWLNAPKEGIDYRLSRCRGNFNAFVIEVEGGCKVSVTSSFSAHVRRYNLILGVWEGEESFASSGVFEALFHSLLAKRLDTDTKPHTGESFSP